jgi:hypothetical protein
MIKGWFSVVLVQMIFLSWKKTVTRSGNFETEKSYIELIE